MKILFNRPTFAGNELKYIQAAFDNGKLSGDGEFTKKCSSFMEDRFSAPKVLLTTSGTHALDMAAMLLNLQEGDEIIVPSYTFSSTANAFILRGAVPIFIDIRADTLNINEDLIEEKITPKTKAIFIVHYAGIGCEMDKIKEIANKHKLPIVEDAAQGVNAKYKDKYLGTIGDLGIYSFHETKNYSCGEGGALVINNSKFIERAEILREKGTDRSKFFRGEVNKYGWVDMGSSYLPSEILAAVLYAQLEKISEIQKKRGAIFKFYYDNLKSLEQEKKIILPTTPAHTSSNYHMFYIILPDEQTRNKLMDYLKSSGILAVFHYLPLHSSKMGKTFGYKNGELPITEALSARLLRLPFYSDLKKDELKYIIKTIKQFFQT